MVRLTKATRFGVGLLGTLAAVAVVAGGLFIATNVEKGTSLAREGQVVSAQVTKEPPKRGENKKYPISYEFVFQGQRIRDRQNVRRSFYDSLTSGGTIDVTVLPRDPAIHKVGRVTNADVEKDLANGVLIMVLVAGLFGGLAWAIRGAAQREARILSDWTAISAQVLEVKKSYGGEHGTTYKIKIRYRVPRQAEIVTETRFTRQGKLDLTPGSFVDIFYNPEDVTRIRMRESLAAAEIDPATY